MNNHEQNHTPEADRIRAELEDRLMDQNLEEVLGGVRPNPEDRTVAPAPAAATEAEPAAQAQPARSDHTWIKPVALLATCAGIGLVLFGGLFSSEQDSSQVAMSESRELPAGDSLRDGAQQTEADLQRLIREKQETVAGLSKQLEEERKKITELQSTYEQLQSEASLEKVKIQLGQIYTKMAEAHDRETRAGVPIIVSNDGKSIANPQPIDRYNHYYSRGEYERMRGIAGKGPSPQYPAATQPGRYDRLGTQFEGKQQLGQAGVPSLNQNQAFANTPQSNGRHNAKAARERYGRAPVLDPQGREDGGKLSLLPNMYGVDPSGRGAPLGWRKQSLEWEDGAVEFDFNVQDTDGSEGVGPGNRGDNYAPIIENDFLSVIDSPLSTFSIDVDTASYSNMRRMLTQNNMLPPPDAVRIEELVNYFNYDYPVPEGEDPFSVNVETAGCPWRPTNRLVRIALKGEEIPFEERPASNLVFLLDVSGSMRSANKLPLLKSCFKMLVDYLTENDTISIVVYASGTRQVLPPTTGDQKAVIMEALDQLQAGGSTNGAGGIQLAYQTATENFIPGGLNRVILATDGDFNVGITSQGDLHRLIEEKAKSNVFLTTLGFGFGNLQDNTIELLADKGNGNYAYIDSLAEGRKVLIDEMGSTLHTIAKDVKIQIEFNPAQVAGYRLIGYENRLLADQDFNDDTKDAGEIGAGHTVTAFYEIIPAGDDVQLAEREVDELEFQRPQKLTKLARQGDMMLVKLRYKEPTEDTSKLLRVLVKDSGHEFTEASRDFQFAASVASFGMLLRNSKYAGQANFKNVLEQAQATLGETPESYRIEFAELVKLSDRLAGQGRKQEPGF